MQKLVKESFPRQVDMKSRGPQEEWSGILKEEVHFPLHSLGLYNNNVSCLRTVSGLNLLANSVIFSSVSSVAQSCLTLCNLMNHSTPGLPIHHQLPEFTQTHVHRGGDAIQPSHPLLSPSPAPNLSQNQGLFQ